MYKILKASKDAYITNRVVNSTPMVSGNVGDAATLDLFKLYGITSTGSVPNTELSRLLIQFDLDPLRTLISSSLLDTTDSSFKCYLKLFDVYAGQPTPKDFTVTVHPLSRSFDEGLGRDVVSYSDKDVVNFLTSSRSEGGWIMSGCMSGGLNGNNVDYLTAFALGSQTSSLESTQYFTTGTEDLLVDITIAVSATLANIIPDKGFRIALTSSLETDVYSYFVKRFASRHAYDANKHPQMIVKFDDAIISDVTNLSLNTSSSLVLYNYNNSGRANILSASSEVNGTNCLLLTLKTPISGGFYQLYFTGSQVTLGSNYATGIYSASVYVDSTQQNVLDKLNVSGSVKFTPIWGSLDGTIGYHTGSDVKFYDTNTSTTDPSTKKFTVSVFGINPEITYPNEMTARVNIFDNTAPQIMLVKTPVKLPGLSIRNVYYQIRNAFTSQVVVPYDTTYHSTKCSSDSDGMFFVIDSSSLVINQTYAIDVLVVSKGNQREHKNVSTFKVVESL